MIEKVICGGQTGADIGAIYGARRAGVATGGTAPNGWRTEKGAQPVLAEFGLKQHESPDYGPRTEANILDSDATVIFSKNFHSPGTVKTVKLAREYDKVFIRINPFTREAEQLFMEFCARERPLVINIAGNRESVAPGISRHVAKIVFHVLSNSSLRR